MKTAIYVEDGAVQLVLTPEDKFEKDALKMFSEKPTRTTIVEGQFYSCAGGWTRWHDYPESYRSLIMRIEEQPSPPDIEQKG
jgi:hypothetical protein